eukprot:NODE_2148_length_1190_cov_188.851008_g1781_i0.p1 GENE.NODE_2148_length_1190_cov_188.851008_g1781_i0~~NODE_2148_length_1190_cov_188.851008_g1781_i0.p1  ORF type:complete len:330 (-),score=165.20 NODE_2148_length_1190_cov_188.851008_g1781_i0:62-1051(-)
MSKARFIGRSYPEKKVNYFTKVNALLDEFSKILIVNITNVRSGQMHAVRIALRGRAELVMGKNTLLKKVFADRLARNETQANIDLFKAFVSGGLLKDNVGLVLTNGDLKEVCGVLGEYKLQASARAGAISPVEVNIFAGNTGLEAAQTTFFQALNIPTKISKGTVEITKDVVILKIGDRVGNSEAALLTKLDMKPFMYGLEVVSIYENGQVCPKEVLDITDEVLQQTISGAVSEVAALSLAIDWPTEASLPHLIVGAFKDVFAISLGTDYTFSDFGADKLKEDIKSGKAVAAAPAASSAPKAAAPAAKKAAAPVVEEEEEETGFDGLFD